MYVSALVNYGVDFDLKQFICAALEYIINLDLYRAIKIELGAKLISELRESNKEGGESINFSYLIFCGKAIFGTHNFGEETKDFTKSTFSEYVSLNIKLLKMAERYATTSKEHFLLVSKLIRESSQLLKLFFKRLGVLDLDSTKLLYLPELEQCLTAALSLNVGSNSLPSSLFVLILNENELSKAINQGKSNFINILTSFTRLISTFVKHANLVNSNPLYVKLHQLLDYFIKSTSALLEAMPYYSLPTGAGLL